MQVSVEDLMHSFDGKHSLFANLSFIAEQGELLAITGPSGSGKSTLLSIIAKWETPTSGTVLWQDIDSIGWVFQNPHGIAGRTALDHVCLPLVAKGKSRAEADSHAQELLERFGLGELSKQPFSTLSGGEAQRLMLARAVAKRPSLLLVDEPTAQLDPLSAASVNHVLGELALDNSIVIVATHDADTKNACQRVIDLRAVVLQGGDAQA